MYVSSSGVSEVTALKVSKKNKSTMANFRYDLIPDQRGEEDRSAGETFRYEEQSTHGSMQALPCSEIAALFRIFVRPGRKQQFAKFPQKLKFRTSARVVSYKIF